MNKNTRAPFFCAATIIGFLFFSCGNFSGLAVPESVSVKCNTRYEGALGQKYYDLSEKFGDDFVKDLEKDSNAKVYKYVPDESDQTQKYILRRKVYDVSLNANDYIDSMNMDESLGEGFAFSKEINLPTVDEKAPDRQIPPGYSADVDFTIQTENFSLDEIITDATITSGEIIIKADGAEDGCYSIDEFKLSGVTQGDGSSDYTKANFVSGGSGIINQKLDLTGAKITLPASQIKATGKLVKGSGSVTAGGTLVCALSIKTIDVKADLTKVGGYVMNDSENQTPLSKEMLAYVTTVNFGQPSGDDYYKSDKDGNITTTKGLGKGIKFNVINSLPAGNNIALTINSPTFEIDSSDGLYVNGVKKTVASDVVIPSKGNETVFEQSYAEFGSLDFSDTTKYGDKDNPKNIEFSVTFSNAQDLTGLEMGKSYKIAVSDSKMLFDWDNMNVALNKADPVEDAVDMSDFSMDKMMSEVDGETKKLVDNSVFKTLPLYLFVQKPTGELKDDFKDLTVEGKIHFDYTGSDSNPKKDYVVGDESTDVNMPMCDRPVWPESGQVCTKVFSEEGKDYSFLSDIAKTMNARAKDLSVAYSMKLLGGKALSLYKARVDSMSKDDSATIAVEMAVVIPLQFDVVKNTDLDIYKIAKMDMDDKDDLMSRDSVSDTETYAKYSGAISYMRLNYNFINTAIDGFKATVKIDDTHEGEPGADKYSGIKREVQITGNDQSDDVIDFTSDEIKAALTHLFMPKMTMTVSAGPLTLKRNALESETSIGVSPCVVLQLNDRMAVDITDIIKK